MSCGNVESFPSVGEWKLCCHPGFTNFVSSSMKLSTMLSEIQFQAVDLKLEFKNLKTSEPSAQRNNFSFIRNNHRNSFHVLYKLSFSFPIALLLPVACSSLSIAANIPRETRYGKTCQRKNFITFSQIESFRLFKPVFRCPPRQLIKEKSIKISSRKLKSVVKSFCAKAGKREFDLIFFSFGKMI